MAQLKGLSKTANNSSFKLPKVFKPTPIPKTTKSNIKKVGSLSTVEPINLFSSFKSSPKAKEVANRIKSSGRELTGPLKGTNIVLPGNPAYQEFWQMNQFGNLSSQINLNDPKVQNQIFQTSLVDSGFLDKNQADKIIEGGPSAGERFFRLFNLIDPSQWFSALAIKPIINIQQNLIKAKESGGTITPLETASIFFQGTTDFLGGALDKLSTDVGDIIGSNKKSKSEEKFNISKNINDLIDNHAKFLTLMGNDEAAQKFEDLSKKYNQAFTKFDLFGLEIPVSARGLAGVFGDIGLDFLLPTPDKYFKAVGLLKAGSFATPLTQNANEIETISKNIFTTINEIDDPAKQLNKAQEVATKIANYLGKPVEQINEINDVQKYIDDLVNYRKSLMSEGFIGTEIFKRDPKRFINGDKTIAQAIEEGQPLDIKNFIESSDQAMGSSVTVDISDKYKKLYKKIYTDSKNYKLSARKSNDPVEWVDALIHEGSGNMIENLAKNPDILYDHTLNMTDATVRKIGGDLEHRGILDAITRRIRSVESEITDKFNSNTFKRFITRKGLDPAKIKAVQEYPEAIRNDVIRLFDIEQLKPKQYQRLYEKFSLEDLSNFSNSITDGVSEKALKFIRENPTLFDGAEFANIDNALMSILENRFQSGKPIDGIMQFIEANEDIKKFVGSYDELQKAIMKAMDEVGLQIIPDLRNPNYVRHALPGTKATPFGFFLEQRTGGETLLKQLKNGGPAFLSDLRSITALHIEDIVASMAQFEMAQNATMMLYNSGSKIISDPDILKYIRIADTSAEKTIEAMTTKIQDAVDLLGSDRPPLEVIQSWISEIGITAKESKLGKILFDIPGDSFNDISKKASDLEQILVNNIDSPNFTNAIQDLSTNLDEVATSSLTDAFKRTILEGDYKDKKQVVQFFDTLDPKLQEILATGHAKNIRFQNVVIKGKRIESMDDLIRSQGYSGMKRLFFDNGITDEFLGGQGSIRQEGIEIVSEIATQSDVMPKPLANALFKVVEKKPGKAESNMLFSAISTVNRISQKLLTFSPSYPITNAFGNTMSDMLVNGFRNLSPARIHDNMQGALALFGDVKMRDFEKISREFGEKVAKGAIDDSFASKFIEKSLGVVLNSPKNFENLKPEVREAVELVLQSNYGKNFTLTGGFTNDIAEFTLTNLFETKKLGALAQGGEKALYKFSKMDPIGTFMLATYGDLVNSIGMMRGFLDKYGDSRVALTKFNDWFQTFDNLLPVEKFLARNTFQFYTWNRTNFLNILKSTATDPDFQRHVAAFISGIKASQSGNLKEKIQNLPQEDWRRNLLWFGNDDWFMMGLKSPLEGAMETARMINLFDPTDAMSAWLNQLNLPLSTAIALGINRDPGTGKLIDPLKDLNAKNTANGFSNIYGWKADLIKKLPNPVKKALDFKVVQNPYTKEDEYLIDPHINYFIEQNPFIFMNRIGKLSDNPETSYEGMNVFQFITGMKVSGLIELEAINKTAELHVNNKIEKLLNRYNIINTIETSNATPLQRSDIGIPQTLESKTEALLFQNSPLTYSEFKAQREATKKLAKPVKVAQPKPLYTNIY